VRRRRTPTLARLKDRARLTLRDRARAGDEPSPALLAGIAEKLAPRDEDELFAIARSTPQLRAAADLRAGVLAALARVLEDERRSIAEGGAEYLELQDRKFGCGGGL
jgi:hypothetical protein